MDIKITKKNMFTALVNLAEQGTLVFADDCGNDVVVTAEQLSDFARNELDLLAARAAKAKERAAAKREKNDDLLEAVFDAVGDEFDLISNIAARVDYDGELSVAKITPRLNALLKDGRVVKGEVVIGGGDGVKASHRAAYKRA